MSHSRQFDFEIKNKLVRNVDFIIEKQLSGGRETG